MRCIARSLFPRSDFAQSCDKKEKTMWIVALALATAALFGAIRSCRDVLRSLRRTNRDWVWY